MLSASGWERHENMATLKLFNCVKNPILIKNARQLCTTVRKFNTETKEDLGKCTPEHDQTIYQGILSAQIKLVKGFSLTTSFISIACQPVLLMNMHQANTNLAVMAGAGAFLSIFTFATPLLIHHISKKYVTELNYNKMEDSYTAITYSLFLRKKEVNELNVIPKVTNLFIFVISDQVQDQRCSCPLYSWHVHHLSS